MRHISVALVASCLVSCSPTAQQPFDFSKADIGVQPGCPTLPGVRNVTISKRSGIDFHICEAIHSPTGKPVFEVYVGEHPPSPDSGLKYGGTTTSNGKTLVWFNTRTTGGWGSPRIWHTYLPTGSPRGTVMVVTLITRSPGELDRIAPLIGHLAPGR